jgi:hypothetical protein
MNRRKRCLSIKIDGKACGSTAACDWSAARFYDEEKFGMADVSHAIWLEEQRHIPCGLAAQMGVVSRDEILPVPERRVVAPQAAQGRREVVRTGPAGAEVFWNEARSSTRPGASLIITEGELDALSFLSVRGSVVSVPNGALTRRARSDQSFDDLAFQLFVG